MKIEYFDVDKEMVWYKSDTPLSLRTGMHTGKYRPKKTRGNYKKRIKEMGVGVERKENEEI